MKFQGWFVAAAINVVVTGYTALYALKIPDTFMSGLATILLLWTLEGIYSASRPSPATQ
ncbi:MAG TPA: hypothetical protein VKA55_01535 [Gammaproteobacteria bacterium]|nr:hypothetical protein [Gammaproteobacteria bacterium]